MSPRRQRRVGHAPRWREDRALTAVVTYPAPKLLPVPIPELPPTLRQQVDRLNAGPTRYAGDAADLVVHAAPPPYDPAAQAAADALRAMNVFADPETIAEWLKVLAAAVDFAPTEKAEFYRRLQMVLRVCGGRHDRRQMTRVEPELLVDYAALTTTKRSVLPLWGAPARDNPDRGMNG